MKKNINIEKQVSDAMMEKPIRFSITTKECRRINLFARVASILRKGRKIDKIQEIDKIHKFAINPPTIGKMQALSKYYLLLDFDDDKLVKEPIKESMRVCKDRVDIVSCLMAIATLNTREELTNDALIKERAEFFKWNASPEDFASVVVAIITQIDYANFISSIRLMKILRLNRPKD